MVYVTYTYRTGFVDNRLDITLCTWLEHESLPLHSSYKPLLLKAEQWKFIGDSTQNPDPSTSDQPWQVMPNNFTSVSHPMSSPGRPMRARLKASMKSPKAFPAKLAPFIRTKVRPFLLVKESWRPNHGWLCCGTCVGIVWAWPQHVVPSFLACSKHGVCMLRLTFRIRSAWFELGPRMGLVIRIGHDGDMVLAWAY